MLKLTLSMIVKNEEKYLRECLDSVKNLLDEIVIVDTGSTDATLRIAEEFGAKIYHFKWIDDFSAARNFALSKSTGDWILYLDADERISEQSKNEIMNYAKSSSNLGVKCIINSVNSKRNDSQRMKYIRLFRYSNNISFIGRAHEQIESSLSDNNYNIVESNIEIIHTGYDASEQELKEKAKRNLNLLLKDYELNKSSYLDYQIANSYSVLKEEIEKIKYYKKALTDRNLNRELRSICYLNIAEYEMRKSNLISAKRYIDEGLNENSEHAMLCLVGTQIYGKLNDYKKAVDLCKKALLVNEEMKSNRISFNNQNILIDNNTIIYQGLLISLISGDQNAFKKFDSYLDSQEAILIDNIIKNKLLFESDIVSLVKIINGNNLEFYTNLLSNYTHDNKIDLMRLLYNKLKLNPLLISYYSSFLISLNQLDDAKRVLENAIEFKVCTAPIFMYLSSIYIQTAKYEELFTLLNNVEPIADKDLRLNQNFTLIKDKLNLLLKKQSTLT